MSAPSVVPDGSYYALKLATTPWRLCDYGVKGCDRPMWDVRKEGRSRFETANEARKARAIIVAEWKSVFGGQDIRIVHIRTAAALKAERLDLRAQAEGHLIAYGTIVDQVTELRARAAQYQRTIDGLYQLRDERDREIRQLRESLRMATEGVKP